MSNKDFQNGLTIGLASGRIVEQEYILPIGGDELGGVKNGGNVVINEDGTMTAPEPEVTNEQVSSAVSEYLTENPFDSSGWSVNAKNLLITVLRNGVYSTDQSENITALKTELAVTEEPDIPDEPDEPVNPEVTLTSISATYSGGDVTVGAAVTDLTGIVVTATYSDGSTQTVTDYTLNGEIAEGSNTITVSYGGKTTTFTVTGVAESGDEPEGIAVTMLDEVSVNNSAAIDYYTDDTLVQQKADNTQGYSNESVTGSNFNWHTDEGSTPYTGFATTSADIAFYTGKTIYDEDTEVKVLIKNYSSQAYDLYVIGCTPDWDGVSAPSNKSVYNCQEIGAGGWNNNANDHEIIYTVKAGTRLFVASPVTSTKVFILNPDTTLNEVTPNSFTKMSISQNIFEKDTQVRIVASSATKQYDSMFIGCTNHDGTTNAKFDIFYMENMGNKAWKQPPYSVDFTYTVKAGYRLIFGSYWSKVGMDVFTITEVV